MSPHFDEMISTATCRVRGGSDDDTRLVSAAQVAERVGWALSLTGELGTAMLADLYHPDNLALLGSGHDGGGGQLPSNAYMAGRRLGWNCPTPDDVYLPDRFRRTVEEQVMRRLRQSVWLGNVISGLLLTWPADPKQRTPDEWKAMWGALPDGTDKATVRNRTRQITAYIETHQVGPAGLCDLEPEVSFGPTLLLSAAD